jgi:hypothetical protein
MTVISPDARIAAIIAGLGIAVGPVHTDAIRTASTGFGIPRGKSPYRRCKFWLGIEVAHHD